MRDLYLHYFTLQRWFDVKFKVLPELKEGWHKNKSIINIVNLRILGIATDLEKI